MKPALSVFAKPSNDSPSPLMCECDAILDERADEPDGGGSALWGTGAEDEAAALMVSNYLEGDLGFVENASRNFFNAKTTRLGHSHDCCQSSSTTIANMSSTKQPLLKHALKMPGLQKLSGKRVVLASNSPRRREILHTFVRSRQAASEDD